VSEELKKVVGASTQRWIILTLDSFLCLSCSGMLLENWSEVSKGVTTYQK